MFLLNKLKVLHKVSHNNLPSYFQTYWEHFTKSVVDYNLRSRVLPVSRVHHVYAESLFVYQLVKMPPHRNKFLTGPHISLILIVFQLLN